MLAYLPARPVGRVRSDSWEGVRPASVAPYAPFGAGASAERHIFRVSDQGRGAPKDAPTLAAGTGILLASYGRLSAQRRHGTDSMRSTSLPISSSKRANCRTGRSLNVGSSNAPGCVQCDHCGLGKDLNKEDHS